MSYSLSMIDNFYAAVDNITKLLVPVTGILGVADFYVSDSCATSTISSTPGYHCNWFTRMFWQHWFELDHVYLHPSRRNYLEHMFSPVKAFNGRNHFVIPYMVQIPYYVWIGKRQSAQPLTNSSKQSGWTRLPYNPAKPEHTQFSTYIYGFTWEDPQADIAALDLHSGDNIMVITSAGDNALAYAAHTNGLTIHCVDMNPCQNHLLELKLAALSTLDYSQFWSMFGIGRLPNFEKVLDTELSAELSLPAYQYWRSHLDTFASNTSNSMLASLVSLGRHNLYTTGYSGLALRCLAVVTKLLGVSKDLEQIAGASSLTDQIKIWCSRVSHNLLSSTSIHILDNPLAIWRLMGVPSNQLKMLHNEGSMSQYVRDTLDPVFLSTHISGNNYFYRMLICQQYSQTCCPDYLTEPAFGKLQEIARNKQDTTFHIHTATIVDTLQKIQPGELSKAVIMDHMDWCTPDEADAEINALKIALKQGGFVLWRSAARIPWYVANFKALDFKVEAIAVRQPNTQTALDRVNMYASFYRATKL
ncbi:hypothetical protein IW148_004455 [Coemansia sp. RSA 1199]|nr:hypothetical protein IW148_004455 [Coemansia sp. RSA 1199]